MPRIALLGSSLVVLVGAGLAAYILYKFVHRQRQLRELRIARISAGELKRLQSVSAAGLQACRRGV